MMKILSQGEFRHFEGVIKQPTPGFTVIINFESGKHIRCTGDHRLLMSGSEWVEAEFVAPGDRFDSGEVAASVQYAPAAEVYDVLNVEDTHSYYSNGVESHNCSLLYVDEAASVPNNVADEFFASTYPVISSGKTSKILLTSTPIGLNHFWKFWSEAESGINNFVPVRVNYWEHPDRDQAWADEQRRLLGDVKFNQEVACLGGNSPVTVRSATDGGEPVTVSFTALARWMEHSECRVPSESIVINDIDLEILTPSGFRQFLGVRKSYCVDPLQLTVGTSVVVASRNHRFVSDGAQIAAQDLQVGQIVCGQTVQHIAEAPAQLVYDPIEVLDGNVYLSAGLINHNCEFIGSSSTLVESGAIQRLAVRRPIFERDGLAVFEAPISSASADGPLPSYILCADTAEGVGGDYSTFSIVRLDSNPFKVVARYRNNQVSPMVFPTIIHKWATEYNNALVLIEANKAEQVGYILHSELEYENMVYIGRNAKGQHIGGTPYQLGLKMDKRVKRTGCSVLKDLIEQSKLDVGDVETISELTTFIENGRGSFSADEGKHDDLVMTLVIFGWFVSDPYFRDTTNVDLRKKLFDARLQSIEEDVAPIGFYDDGLEPEVEPGGWVNVSVNL